MGWGCGAANSIGLTDSVSVPASTIWIESVSVLASIVKIESVMVLASIVRIESVTVLASIIVMLGGAWLLCFGEGAGSASVVGVGRLKGGCCGRFCSQAASFSSVARHNSVATLAYCWAILISRAMSLAARVVQSRSLYALIMDVFSSGTSMRRAAFFACFFLPIFCRALSSLGSSSPNNAR